MRGNVFVIGVLLVLILGTFGIASALPNQDGSDWKYYENITIKENSGARLEDYQVLLNLDSDNFDFSKARSDGRDIRFFNEEGDKLYYWIEDFDPYIEVAKIWVKVPDIPADDEIKIKMYYGNKNTESESNGDKTFDFFDDFEGDSLNKAKWNSNAGNAISVDDGIIYMTGDWDYHQYFISSDERFRTPVVVEARVRLSCYQCGNDLEVGFVRDRDDHHRINEAIFAGFDHDDSPRSKYIYYRGNEIISSKQDLRTTDWFNIQISYTYNKIKFWDSYTQGTQTCNNYMNNPFYLSIAGDTDNHNNEDAIDWIFIRSYASEEPTLIIEQEEVEEGSKEETEEEDEISKDESKEEKEDLTEPLNITKEEIPDAINSILRKIDSLERMDVDTSLIETALEGASESYEMGEYEESIELLNNAQSMADDAYDSLTNHIEPAHSEIDEARELGADVKGAEDMLEDAEDALKKGNYDYAKSWADNATELAKNSTIGSIDISNLKAVPTKYNGRNILLTGTIRDISTIFGEGYTFALDDGTGIISVDYKGVLGDIEDGDKITVVGIFEASNGSINSINVNSGGAPGFEATLAVAGLLSVAYILKRRFD
ncbi:MAG: DUF2341 domain-containing protein [Halobacteriota archaeon]|nr:DUF2341 domain-containing protein [Halobacteriota archaeon]